MTSPLYLSASNGELIATPIQSRGKLACRSPSQIGKRWSTRRCRAHGFPEPIFIKPRFVVLPVPLFLLGGSARPDRAHLPEKTPSLACQNDHRHLPHLWLPNKKCSACPPEPRRAGGFLPSLNSGSSTGQVQRVRSSYHV